MPKLVWDESTARLYELGVDHGVLYVQGPSDSNAVAYAWNGLVSVTESPEGAESNPQYADNIKYLDIVSAENFKATIEAFTYPKEFGICDGTLTLDGVMVGQQPRRSFGLCYRTKVGSAAEGMDKGYKIHVVYNCMAAPSEKQYQTVSDSPEPITFSWELTSTPVSFDYGGVTYNTSTLAFDSAALGTSKMKILEDLLYGTSTVSGKLPMPGDILSAVGTSSLDDIS